MTRPIVLAAFAVAAALLSGLTAWWMQTAGLAPLAMPWTVLPVLLAIAGLVLWWGLPVRRWNAGDRSKPLDPLKAARTVALAKAVAHAGAIFTGWYFGAGIGLVADLGIDPRRERFVLSMAATVAAVLVTAAGLLVERWCRRPPEDEEDESARESGYPAR